MTKGLVRSLNRAPGQQAHLRKKLFKVEDLELTFTGDTGNAVEATAVIGGLDEGNILILGAVSYLSFAGSGSDANLTADWEGIYGVGTTPADDATISGDDVDIIASTDLGPATAEVVARTRGVGEAQSIVDNTDGSLEVNLNVVLDADEATDTEDVVITVNGEVEILYSVILND
jgi:hypothetical protein